MALGSDFDLLIAQGGTWFLIIQQLGKTDIIAVYFAWIKYWAKSQPHKSSIND